MEINSIVPHDIEKIILEKGIWGNTDIEPLYLSAMEVTHNGVDLISYQIEFSAGEKLGMVNTLLEQKEIELDGDGWELFIRKFIKERNPDLEKNLFGDSESETCVLWVDNREDYIKTLEHLLNLINLKFD